MVLLCGMTPALAVVLQSVLRQFEWRRRSTSLERKAWYLDFLLSTPQAAAEIRLFGLGKYFQQGHAAIREKLRNGRLSIAAAQAWSEIIASTLGWAAGAGASRAT